MSTTPENTQPGTPVPDDAQPIAVPQADAATAAEAPTDDRLQDVESTPHLMTDSATDTERRNGGDRWQAAMQGILNGSALVTVLAVVLALVACGILIAITDENVRAAAGYFFARPGDTIQAIGTAVGGSYASLFQGSVINFGASSFQQAIVPLTRSIDYAVPLIAAGLGIALSFRAGLFNIGGQGQILMGAAAAGWVGFSFDGPAALHIPLTIIAGIVGGAVWAGIVGVLKARTGANEVVLTIMLNYVALYLVSYLLRTPGLLQAPGSTNPISPATKDSAVLPALFGPR